MAFPVILSSPPTTQNFEKRISKFLSVDYSERPLIVTGIDQLHNVQFVSRIYKKKSTPKMVEMVEAEEAPCVEVRKGVNTMFQSLGLNLGGKVHKTPGVIAQNFNWTRELFTKLESK